MDGRFPGVWLMDFEFHHVPGEAPVVLCVVALEVRSGQLVRKWIHGGPPMQPLMHKGDLLVAYMAAAEMSCFHALGWPEPDHVLDLFAEFRILTNGLLTPKQAGLLEALKYFELSNGVTAETKDRMRCMAVKQTSWDARDQAELVDYCETDVRALEMMLPAMSPNIDWPRALIRGRYVVALSRAEAVGVPIDVPRLSILRDRWEDIRIRLAYMANLKYPVGGHGLFEGTAFKESYFEDYLSLRHIDWPQHPNGKLRLDDKDTFRDMSRLFPEFKFLRDTRRTLARMLLSEMPVGGDGRNRTQFWPFSSRTGRNQPKSSEFVFGMPAWMRGLVRPEPGMALASVDYCQQEFGIGAALSEDPAMAEIYRAGDLYMALAIRVGAAPEGATAETHPEARDRHKTVTLATQFGQTDVGLGQRLDIPPIYAARLIEDFWKSFPRYRQWSRDVYDTACLRRPRVMEAAFGWRATCGPFLDRELSIRNWPLQATGSEILRVAMIKCMEEGVRVCAPIHDALLIEAPERDVKDAIETTQRVMREAGEVTLSGFVLRTDAKEIRHPNRYADKRGVDTWNTIHEMLGLEQ